MSILSFPERGPWGDPKWPGNCSGHVYKSLFEQLKPKTALDLFSGSRTAQQVAAELGIDCVSLDLKDGFNVLRHSVLEAVGHEVWTWPFNTHPTSTCKFTAAGFGARPTRTT